MVSIWDWVESDDCVVVDSESNGFGRGDGYDTTIYRSVLTGRYIVWTREIGCRSSWWTARSLTGAQAVVAAGYTPGGGPGDYRGVLDPARLREVRALRAR